MKITLLSRSDSDGGAAVACRRLFLAFRSQKFDAQMLVQDKRVDNDNIKTTTETKIEAYYDFWRFAFERLIFTFSERSKSVRFAFSMANTGLNLSKRVDIQFTDIIHTHWFNFGFLSLKNYKQLINLGKPMVWTLHDMWAFTGGCHYAGDCQNFKTECMNCPFLKNPSANDLSNQIWKKKQDIFNSLKTNQLTIVCCSEWLAGVARQSSLLKNIKVVSIANPLNINTFQPQDKSLVRRKFGLPDEKLLVLFGAMNIADQRKGFDYFLNALIRLKAVYPELSQKIELLIFGKSKPELMSKLPFPAHNMGSIKSEASMAEVLNCADLFVIPSLEENLPNSISESFACGVPVVGFNTGGIPEMIAHKQNGYVADYKSATSLSDGIAWVLSKANTVSLSENARQKALNSYSESVVAQNYMKLYRKIFVDFH